jgi:hypothetical protein
LAGATLIDLHDHAGGYDVLAPVEFPDEAWSRLTVESPYVDGEFETAARLAGGRVSVGVLVEGVTWAQVETRRLAIRSAYLAHPSFLLDVTLEGVTQTFRANRPDVSSLGVAPADMARKERRFTLSFPVQPNPTVTGA